MAIKRKIYSEESFALNIARQIPEVNARYSTLEEDCGFHKADIVLESGDLKYFIQVSKSPKSKKQQKFLKKRGTFPIFTNDFYGNYLPLEEIYKQLNQIVYT